MIYKSLFPNAEVPKSPCKTRFRMGWWSANTRADLDNDAQQEVQQFLEPFREALPALISRRLSNIHAQSYFGVSSPFTPECIHQICEESVDQLVQLLASKRNSTRQPSHIPAPTLEKAEVAPSSDNQLRTRLVQTPPQHPPNTLANKVPDGLTTVDPRVLGQQIYSSNIPQYVPLISNYTHKNTDSTFDVLGIPEFCECSTPTQPNPGIQIPSPSTTTTAWDHWHPLDGLNGDTSPFLQGFNADPVF